MVVRPTGPAGLAGWTRCTKHHRRHRAQGASLTGPHRSRDVPGLQAFKARPEAPWRGKPERSSVPLAPIGSTCVPPARKEPQPDYTEKPRAHTEDGEVWPARLAVPTLPASGAISQTVAQAHGWPGWQLENVQGLHVQWQQRRHSSFRAGTRRGEIHGPHESESVCPSRNRRSEPALCPPGVVTRVEDAGVPAYKIRAPSATRNSGATAG